MIAPEQRKLLPFGNHPEMLPMLEQQLRMLEENIQRENQVINHMGQITSQRVSSTNMANMVRTLLCICIYIFTCGGIFLEEGNLLVGIMSCVYPGIFSSLTTYFNMIFHSSFCLSLIISTQLLDY